MLTCLTDMDPTKTEEMRGRRFNRMLVYVAPHHSVPAQADEGMLTVVDTLGLFSLMEACNQDFDGILERPEDLTDDVRLTRRYMHNQKKGVSLLLAYVAAVESTVTEYQLLLHLRELNGESKAKVRHSCREVEHLLLHGWYYLCSYSGTAAQLFANC